MADKRINALTVTATASASDDFIAIDGSANGTRKLSAYSPTFGGNLTVSGTGISVGSSAASGVIYDASTTSRFGWYSGGTYVANSSGSASILVPSSGNVLVGTTTDSGAKFTVYKSNGGNVNGAANAAIYLPIDESNIQGPGTNTVIRMGGNLVLSANSTWLAQTNGVTAQTIDSSQNATFAGKVTTNAISGINALAAGTQLATFESSVNGAAVELITKGKNSTGTARQANIGLNRFADDVMSISDGTTERLRLGLTNGNLTVTGALKLGNAYTAGAPTATGYVTIQDSAGNTYKVLVGT